MALTREEMDRKIDEHFRFEAQDDVEGVLATLSEDVEHDIVGPAVGPDARARRCARLLRALFADLADGQVTCLRRLHGDGFLVDESLWRGTARRAAVRRRGQGPPAASSACSTSSSSRRTATSGRENVWVDLAAILRQLPRDEGS